MYFTDSPYERPMQDTARGHPDDMPPPKPEHPCFGCGNYISGCRWPCWKKLLSKDTNRGEP